MGKMRVPISTCEITRLLEFDGYRPHPDRCVWYKPGSMDPEITMKEIVERSLEIERQEVGNGS